MAIDALSRLAAIGQQKSTNTNEMASRQGRGMPPANEKAAQMAQGRGMPAVNDKAAQMAQGRGMPPANERAVQMANGRVMPPVNERAVQMANGRVMPPVNEKAALAAQRNAEMELETSLRRFRQSLTPAAASVLDMWLRMANENR